jgi:hypothetical protein
MQGDIASAIDEMVKKLQVNTAASANSQQIIEGHVQNVIDTYNDAIAQKKEMYQWDAKNESLWGYFKRVQKEKEKIYKERQKRKNNIQFLEEQINHYKEKENKAINNHKNELGQALFKRRAQLEIEKNVKEAMDSVADTVETGAKSGNPYLAAIMVVGGVIIGAAKMLFNVAVSIVKVGFSFLSNILGADFGFSAVYEKFLKMQKLVGGISADSGLLAQESVKFLNKMPMIMQEVLDVGGSIEQVGEAYEGYNKLTNRNRVFSGVEFKSIIELGLGTGLGVSAASELVGNFENLGYSLDRTLKFTSFVRDKTMAVSQNQTKVLKKTSETITELTGFGIEKGLEGMVKLVIKTQKARIDVKKSVGAFKDAFTDPETAIEVAATARLLGGKFATYFSDPFMLMAKSIEDPLQLTADLMEVVKGKAFKGRNGFQISPADRELIREFAKSIGQDADELFNAAIEDAKYTDKIEALRKRNVSTFGLTDEQNELLTNLMTLNEDGSYSIRLSNGVIQRLENIPGNTEIYAILNQERKNQQSALLRNSLAERIGIVVDRFTTAFSQVFVELNNLLTNHNTLNNLDETVKAISSEMIIFLDKAFSEGGSFRQNLMQIFNTMSIIMDKILSIWKDPKKEFGEKFSETIYEFLDGLDIGFKPILKFAGGFLLEKIGKLIDNATLGVTSLEKSGLEMQKNALIVAGQDSVLFKTQQENLVEKITIYNEKNGGMDMTGLTNKSGAKMIEASAHIIAKNMQKNAFKTVGKRIPGLGLAIGVFDAIGQAMDGDYGQATIALASGIASTVPGVGTLVSIGLDATNAYIDYSSGDNVINKDGLMIKTEDKIIKGRKDDALLLFDQKATQSAQDNLSIKKPIVTLNLTGTIDMTQHDLDDNGIKDATNIVSKQIINQMAYNA